MGYKNKTNEEYQREYYLKNRSRKKQYYLDYYKKNTEYVIVYQTLYQRNRKYEQERDLKKVYIIQNNFNISLEE